MSITLSVASLSRLVGVHPDLKRVVVEAAKRSSQDFKVVQGVRTLAEQKANLAKGASKTLKSKHLPQPDGFGHAVDLAPLTNGELDWKWGTPGAEGPVCLVAEAMSAAAISLGVELVWGAVWDRGLNRLHPGELRLAVEEYKARHAGKDFLDGGHFQLKETTT